MAFGYSWIFKAIQKVYGCLAIFRFLVYQILSLEDVIQAVLLLILILKELIGQMNLIQM